MYDQLKSRLASLLSRPRAMKPQTERQLAQYLTEHSSDAPAFFLCAGLYGLGWLQLRGVKTRTTGGIKRGESFVESFGAGIRYTWSQPLIRMVLVMVFFRYWFRRGEELTPAGTNT